jgi:hypothetical protein
MAESLESASRCNWRARSASSRQTYKTVQGGMLHIIYVIYKSS